MYTLRNKLYSKLAAYPKIGSLCFTILIIISWVYLSKASTLPKKLAIQYTTAIIANIQALHSPIVYPIKQKDFKYISSVYGWRQHPIHQKWHFHNGIDIVPKNSKAFVHSISKGIIIAINKNTLLAEGKSIRIKHINGLESKYAHLAFIHVQLGESIAAGQVIGQIGSTGQITGRHLHYELHYNNHSIDPLLFHQSSNKGF